MKPGTPCGVVLPWFEDLGREGQVERLRLLADHGLALAGRIGPEATESAVKAAARLALVCLERCEPEAVIGPAVEAAGDALRRIGLAVRTTVAADDAALEVAMPGGGRVLLRWRGGRFCGPA